jgi:hypothetical protein
MSAHVKLYSWTSSLRRAGGTNDLLVHRIAKSTGILIAIITALLIATLTSKAQSALVAAQTANAWTFRAAPAVQISLDAFVADWQATRASANDATTLQWSVNDITHASASLYALDASRAKTQRINVVKRDGRVAISAEVSP